MNENIKQKIKNVFGCIGTSASFFVTVVIPLIRWLSENNFFPKVTKKLSTIFNFLFDTKFELKLIYLCWLFVLVFLIFKFVLPLIPKIRQKKFSKKNFFYQVHDNLSLRYNSYFNENNLPELTNITIICSRNGKNQNYMQEYSRLHRTCKIANVCDKKCPLKSGVVFDQVDALLQSSLLEYWEKFQKQNSRNNNQN